MDKKPTMSLVIQSGDIHMYDLIFNEHLHQLRKVSSMRALTFQSHSRFIGTLHLSKSESENESDCSLSNAMADL